MINKSRFLFKKKPSHKTSERHKSSKISFDSGDGIFLCKKALSYLNVPRFLLKKMMSTTKLLCESGIMYVFNDKKKTAKKFGRMQATAQRLSLNISTKIPLPVKQIQAETSHKSNKSATIGFVVSNVILIK